ncbi:MAG: tripartite tricarboxylate transporter substrate binding protein [Rhodospirillaceae bacterium]|nr:tripartite tricarboxylate transporter substrate binding protein [Rhodospirillaceae bacterium]
MTLLARTGVAAIGLGLVVSFGTVTYSSDADAAWKPRKPVEFVIMAGKGGGADRLARFIQGIVQKNKFSPRPFVPVNKGGGSGAEALRQLKDSGGNPHMIMATLNSYYTTPLRNPGLGVDISNFTPIARLAEDTFQLWVTVDSGIKSVEDYVKTVKKAGRASWKMGGTGKGQEDSLVTGLLEQKFGFRVTYVPFKGGGTVAKQLIGKHINSTVNNPSEQVGFWDAGKSRPLASFTPKGKLKGKWGKIPTFEELGYGKDMVYYMQRSVVGPPGMSKDAQAFYVGVFQKVYQSSPWQNYLAKKGLVPGWLTGSKLQSYFIAERAKHADLLKALK